MAGYAGEYGDHGDHVYDRRSSPRQLPPPYPPSSATGAWGAPPRGVDYEPPTSPGSLKVPRSERSHRPRSLPPPIGWRSSWSRDGDDEDDDYYKDDRERRRARGGGGSRQRDHSRSRRDDDRDGESVSPLEKARNLLKDTFTDSTTGLGVGVVGALLGGLAAREAAEATSSHHGRHHSQDSNDEAAAAQRRNQALATMVGAAVGALGANAVEKRLELGRDRDRAEQDRKHRRSSRGDGDDNDRASLAYMDQKRRSGGDYEVIEKREVVTRPRSGGDYDYYYDRRGSGGGDSRALVLARPRSKDDYDRGTSASGWDWVDDAAALESQVSKRESKRGGGRGAIEREIDPEAKSWRNVEDWVYSDGGARAADLEREKFYRDRERRRRSEEQRYRY